MRLSRLPAVLVPLVVVLAACPAAAAEGAVDGRALSLWWVLPFAGVLLSIAIVPLIAPHWWHRFYGLVMLGWALAFVIPAALAFGAEPVIDMVLHTALLEYIPFLILLFALFTVAGGVHLAGTLRGTPGTNTALLAFGTAIASLTGTTGASMLLVRPMLRANRHRKHRAHTVIFFIFLVSNIGGSLTPLGDPPLFLGFLKGVEFFWPTQHLFAPMLLLAAMLLLIYHRMESRYFRREPDEIREGGEAVEPLRIQGGVNIPLLLMVVLVVLMEGIWHPGAVTFLKQRIAIEVVVGDVLMLLIAGYSIWATPALVRNANGFTWGAMIEVAKVFAAIFVTIIPAIAILQAGREGALAGLVLLTSDADGNPDPTMYFWLTGLLSSFLDNAPTYLVFFNLAGGDAQTLMGPLAPVLGAISAGAVFMGANSYIGNAPNFMVRAIAEEQGVKMPSFLGYCGWAVVCLIPNFALLTLIFYR
ncbi:sodium:proton antiporter [Elioraea sp.]|uniref:sodium:proton antiporter n=1 Tax=Elioraea sp. TaxID=2185103 RepID=UPI0021DF4007|nr:sodium:proton antiporter [Elioraea sp.]GIX09649.1 MAG: sodium:proton antiporter [Elioraea sp.]